MILFKLKKEQSPSFPNLLDSLNLYKDAIIESVEEDDLQKANINFSKLISILDYHNQLEKKLNNELNEAKKRYRAFKRQIRMTDGSLRRVSVN